MVAGSSPAGPTIFKRGRLQDLSDLFCERQPDFVLGLWHFYFDEMLQWHDSEKRFYKIKLNEKRNSFLFYSDQYERWVFYTDSGDEKDAQMVYDAYVDHNINKLLLE